MISKIEKLALFIVGIFSLILFGKTSRLTKENKKLNSELKHSEKKVAIQKKVIDVTKNTKPSDFTGILKRMRNKEL